MFSLSSSLALEMIFFQLPSVILHSLNLSYSLELLTHLRVDMRTTWTNGFVLMCEYIMLHIITLLLWLLPPLSSLSNGFWQLFWGRNSGNRWENLSEWSRVSWYSPSWLQGLEFSVIKLGRKDKILWFYSKPLNWLFLFQRQTTQPQ